MIFAVVKQLWSCFTTAKVLHNCEDHFQVVFFIRSSYISYIWFSYIILIHMISVTFKLNSAVLLTCLNGTGAGRSANADTQRFWNLMFDRVACIQLNIAPGGIRHTFCYKKTDIREKVSISQVWIELLFHFLNSLHTRAFTEATRYELVERIIHIE